MAQNKLWFGDNLTILRSYVASESVDLIYLDPPFNSNASYNLLFKSVDGAGSDSQLQAFDDSWHWSNASAMAFDEVMATGCNAATMLRALRSSLGENDMMAYLTMMCVRLIEMHRVLKDAGSLYLHCDPTASHYLKIILDAIFGPAGFRTETSWKRSSAHNDAKQGRRQYGNIRDVILFYTKSPEAWTWNWQFTDYDESYVAAFYKHEDAATGRRFRTGDLTAGKGGGDTSYEWRIKRLTGGDWQADLDGEFERPRPGWDYDGKPPYSNRYWAYSLENMRAFERQGRLVYASTGMPSYKRYLDEMPGVPLQNSWDDIRPPSSKERLGYPTQKPLRLLERIIASSSNPGDVVLDPFCGCGTAIHAAEKLGRQWIGIDVTHLAIQVIKDRFKQHFPSSSYELGGVPTTIDDAKALAQHNKIQFEFWVVGHIGGQPKGFAGADRGVDGQFMFKSGARSTGSGIISVKGGRVIGPAMVRDLRGVIERESAEIGVLICLDEPSQAMKTEAAAAGIYKSDNGEAYPRLQIFVPRRHFSRSQSSVPAVVYDRDGARRSTPWQATLGQSAYCAAGVA
jgi:DNA modification methylase